MIALLKGTIAEKGPGTVVLDTGAVGYEVVMPASLVDRLGPVGTAVELRTVLIVREDAHELFGFMNRDQVEVFRLLRSVTRIGPRQALKVLSDLTPAAVVEAVLRKDEAAFQRVSGIGADGARRLVAELAKKVGKLELTEGVKTSNVVTHAALHDQVAAALTGLGYKPAEVDRSLAHAFASDVTGVSLGDLVKRALAYFQKDKGNRA
jgi:Holliday junction DNA helicase RuvA